ncbi:carcinoembryonic antigen-related cell adhesion molecule 21-like [Peromyscus leucopus]|uniref:carcinoembryonic antigen-related cell adhesion molecule 21-like n=1 Tax=Peromyscus leucopus TaxID=10041 RepID=UPI0018859768|nr:carcinoembryonic antigen-related cell adhesion molecule 21-like [Peromyscus leucopus]
MELSSAPLHKVQVSWRGLLLTVSLLTYWTSPTTAQDFTVEAVPLNVAVGSNVLLLAHNVPDRITLFSWCKPVSGVDTHIVVYYIDSNIINYMPGYEDTLTMYPNKSLLIKNVRKDDPGDYKAAVLFKNNNVVFQPLKFHVYEPVTKPSIQFTNTTVNSVTSVLLNCFTNDTGISIHWLFKGQSLRITNRTRLSSNNSTLEIVPARSLHSGDYQCEVSNQFGSQRSEPIRVDIIDSLTPPSIQVTNNTVKDMLSVFLNCLSNNTGISVHWLFKGQSVELSDRIKLSHNNSTLQIDSVRIEDSGDYQCEVSNQVSSMRSNPIQLDIIGTIHASSAETYMQRKGPCDASVIITKTPFEIQFQDVFILSPKSLMTFSSDL